jgi:serine/threonine protein kinase
VNRLFGTLLWIEDLARDVAFIASIGYVYGDLRLDNLLLDDMEHVKLCDFGATVRFGEDLQAFHVPFWDDDCDVASCKSEQFALASCLYNIITGSEPYAELDTNEAK